MKKYFLNCFIFFGLFIFGMTAILTVSWAQQPDSASWIKNRFGLYIGFRPEPNYDQIMSLFGRQNVRFVDINHGYKLGKDGHSLEMIGDAQFFFKDPQGWSQYGVNGSKPHVRLAAIMPLAILECTIDEVKEGTDPKCLDRSIATDRIRMQKVIDGAWDQDYLKVGNLAVQAGHADMIIRLGHECDSNGVSPDKNSYYPWDCREGNEDVYVQAFRHVVKLFRSVPGQKFEFDYQGTSGFSKINRNTQKTYMESSYPGDDYVDNVGLDIYHSNNFYGAGHVYKPEMFLNSIRIVRQFAIGHGKLFSVPEWGLVNNLRAPWWQEVKDNPDFVDQMISALEESPADGPGSLEFYNYFQGVDNFDITHFPKAQAKLLHYVADPSSS